MIATISMNIEIVVKFHIFHIIWSISLNNYTFYHEEIKSRNKHANVLIPHFKWWIAVNIRLLGRKIQQSHVCFI